MNSSNPPPYDFVPPTEKQWPIFKNSGISMPMNNITSQINNLICQYQKVLEYGTLSINFGKNTKYYTNVLYSDLLFDNDSVSSYCIVPPECLSPDIQWLMSLHDNTDIRVCVKNLRVYLQVKHCDKDWKNFYTINYNYYEKCLIS